MNNGLLTGMTMFILLSCSDHSPYVSNEKIVNGVETDQFLAVVNMLIDDGEFGYYRCTGTFITSRTILTAAHCVDDAIAVEWGEYRATDIIFHAGYDKFRFDWISHDIALVRFDQDVAPATMEISNIAVEDGDQLIMVGYGIDRYGSNRKPSPDAISGVKKIGYNLYQWNDRLVNEGIIKFDGHYTNVDIDQGTGEWASIGQGDSGGPIIVEGKGIVGIASGQRVDVEPDRIVNYSYHNHIRSDTSFAFLRKVIAMGYLDGIQRMPEIPELPVADLPHDPDRPDGVFGFAGVGGNGVWGIEFYEIPEHAEIIKVILKSSYNLELAALDVNDREAFETDYSWGLGEEPVIYVELYDGEGDMILSLEKTF